MLKQAVIVYEDRADHLIGVKLLLASLRHFEPGMKIKLVLPGLPDYLTSQFTDYSQITVDSRQRGLSGWDVKPELLSEALDDGYENALWLDADLILTAPLVPLLDRFAADSFITTEEPLGPRRPGSALRTPAWGLPLGRVLPVTLNSSVIRASRSHRDLLEAWVGLLRRNDYRAAQALSWNIRPDHLMGDQDALTALLGAHEFADIPLGLLRQGIDIAHCFNEDGFSVSQRIRHAFRPLPPLVHAQGRKPWVDAGNRALHTELSPYCWAALPFASALTPDERGWIGTRSKLGQVLTAVGFGDPALAGLAPAMWRTSVRAAGRCISPITARLKLPRKETKAAHISHSAVVASHQRKHVES